MVSAIATFKEICSGNGKSNSKTTHLATVTASCSRELPGTSGMPWNAKYLRSALGWSNYAVKHTANRCKVAATRLAPSSNALHTVFHPNSGAMAQLEASQPWRDVPHATAYPQSREIHRHVDRILTVLPWQHARRRSAGAAGTCARGRRRRALLRVCHVDRFLQLSAVLFCADRRFGQSEREYARHFACMSKSLQQELPAHRSNPDGRSNATQ